MFFYKSNLEKQPLFFADNTKIIISGCTLYGKDISELRVNCSLGKIFPVRKYLDRIDELVEYPPLIELTGSVEIKTVNGNYSFPKVYRIMEAYVFFKRIFDGTQAFYTYRNTTLPYRYGTALKEDFFDKRKNFSVAFILDEEGNDRNNEKILEIREKWSTHCGFRRARADETCTFNEIVFFNGYDRWITSYDDSLEGLTAIGLKEQSKICATMHGHKVIIITVYDYSAMMLAYGSGDDIRLYYFGDERILKLLHCDKIPFSDDYSVLEELAFDKDGASVKEILQNEDKSIKQRLTELAKKLDINDYFIRAGFYDVSVMNAFEMREFANGYQTLNYRIRVDEKRINGKYESMYQGSSAFDVLRADKSIKMGRPYNITLKNIGRSSMGIVLCVRSEEIHKAIKEGLMTCNIPIRMTNCRFTRVKKIYEYENDIPSSPITMTEFSKTSAADEENVLFENIPFDMEYNLFFGNYAFVHEGTDKEIPKGVVINNDNIKNESDREEINKVLLQAAVSITFTLESDINLSEPIEIMVIPMENIYGGIAKLKINIEV